MPHLDLSPTELDRLYPRIPAPVDERLDDMVDDISDSTLQSGIRIANGIRTAMMTQGRPRRRELDGQEENPAEYGMEETTRRRGLGNVDGDDAEKERVRPASFDFMTGAGVRQSPGLSVCGLVPAHQVPSTPHCTGPGTSRSSSERWRAAYLYRRRLARGPARTSRRK